MSFCVTISDSVGPKKDTHRLQNSDTENKQLRFSIMHQYASMASIIFGLLISFDAMPQTPGLCLEMRWYFFWHPLPRQRRLSPSRKNKRDEHVNTCVLKGIQCNHLFMGSLKGTVDQSRKTEQRSTKKRQTR